MAMSRTRRALIAISALVCLAAAGAGIYLYRLHVTFYGMGGKPPDLLSLLPPGAPVVVYIDVAALRRLQGSPLAAMLALATAGPQEDRDYQMFVRDTGFDYTRDLDKAAIAVWPASLLAASSGLGENQVWAVADGRFDEEKIKAFALRTGKLATHGTQSLYEIPGNPPTSLAFLSPTRIVLASGKSLNVLASPPDGGAGDLAMRARVERVAGAPIFAVAQTDALPSSFYDNFRNSPQLERLARSVKGLTLAGQPQGDRMDVAIDAECDSMTNAVEMSTLIDTLRLLGATALSDPKTRRSMSKEQAALLAAVANQVKVMQQDRWVRLTLEITPEMLAPSNSKHADLR
jgi:hypothetical protein